MREQQLSEEIDRLQSIMSSKMQEYTHTVS